jgi:hypothetical protein
MFILLSNSLSSFPKQSLQFLTMVLKLSPDKRPPATEEGQKRLNALDEQVWKGLVEMYRKKAERSGQSEAAVYWYTRRGFWRMFYMVDIDFEIPFEEKKPTDKDLPIRKYRELDWNFPALDNYTRVYYPEGWDSSAEISRPQQQHSPVRPRPHVPDAKAFPKLRDTLQKAQTPNTPVKPAQSQTPQD